MKPLLKWAGGKKRLLPAILNRLPETFDTYIEPFIGGGALFFELAGRYPGLRAVINDINPDLMALYRAARDNAAALADQLEEWGTQYRACRAEAQQRLYLDIRAAYNARQLPPLQRAAAFVFLNKTCFNGLHRVNKRGEFNVPWGGNRKPLLLDLENLQAASRSLRGADILCGDFAACAAYAGPGAFCYLDPPYRATFTAYAPGGFGDPEQVRLAEFAAAIGAQGTRYMVSNSAADDGFFAALYAGCTIERISAPRAISARGSGRGTVPELLIRNY